jgi:hypothetical protein
VVSLLAMVHSLFIVQAFVIAKVFADASSPFEFNDTAAVPVELFVMSKCPDAVSCESTFAKVCK